MAIYKRHHRREDGTLVRARRWSIDFTDHTGKRRTVSGFHDKRATEAKYAQLVQDAERQRAGLDPLHATPAKVITFDRAANAYEQHLVRTGASLVHIKYTRSRLAAVRAFCKFQTLADIKPAPLTDFLNSLIGKRKTRTINSFRDTLVALANFCVGQQWLASNPVANVAKAKSHEEKTRRAYTQAEFERLTSPCIPEPRRRIYMVAGLSGLRRSELQRLKVNDLYLNQAKPCWNLRASATKARRQEQVPMLPACASILREIVKGKQKQHRVFKRVPGLKQLYRDQKRADIKAVDATGRNADWHSLRYYFATMIARKLPIQKVRILMRHRDIRTTINLYSDLGLADVGDDVWAWPEEMK
jgi:integrase